MTHAIYKEEHREFVIEIGHYRFTGMLWLRNLIYYIVNLKA